MRVLRNILSQLYKYVLWLVLTVVFWAWIFGMLTDTVPAKKLLVCVDRTQVEDQAMSVALEKDLPDGIRMVKVHPFGYYMFGSEELLSADLYIVGEGRAEEYLDSFRPLAETGFPAEDRPVWSSGGTAYGLMIYDAESGEGAASSYVGYEVPGEEKENCYLFFGAKSRHLEDGTAQELAQTLLLLP